jgi:hypothetical protein
MFETTDLQRFTRALVSAAETAAQAPERMAELSDDMTARYAEQVIQAMIARTRSGRDANDKPFAPYSPGYQKVTGKKTVDLTILGELLNSIVYRSTGVGSGEITIETGMHYSGLSLKDLAGAHQHGEGHLPSRQFFGWRRNAPADLRLRSLTVEEFRQHLRRIFE